MQCSGQGDGANFVPSPPNKMNFKPTTSIMSHKVLKTQKKIYLGQATCLSLKLSRLDLQMFNAEFGFREIVLAHTGDLLGLST